MIVNTAHVSFNARDFDGMLRFYCGTLGLKRKFTLTHGALASYFRANRATSWIPPERFEERVGGFEALGDVPWLTYLEIADHQFLEMFNPVGETADAPHVEACYGYQKIALEVGDAFALHAELVAKGVVPKSEIRETPDFALAFNLDDPEGNHLEIVQYTPRSPQVADTGVQPGGTAFRHTAQTAFQTKDIPAALRFYCEGLGLKHAFTMKYGDLVRAIRSTVDPSAAPDSRRDALLAQLDLHSEEPWIEFLQTGEHQFLELFHVSDEKTWVDPFRQAYGFLHFCLEVDDIRATRESVERNGIVPDTATSLGLDGSWQFWVHDPDGNRIELMQYTAESMQLREGAESLGANR